MCVLCIKSILYSLYILEKIEKKFLPFLELNIYIKKIVSSYLIIMLFFAKYYMFDLLRKVTSKAKNIIFCNSGYADTESLSTRLSKHI